MRIGAKWQNITFIASKMLVCGNYSKTFIIYILVLKTIQLLGIFLPFAYNLFYFQSWQLLMVTILCSITIILLIQLLQLSSFKREYIIRLIGFHEMIIFMVIPVMLYTFIGLAGMVFLLVFGKNVKYNKLKIWDKCHSIWLLL